jgi:lactam utilization protein B
MISVDLNSDLGEDFGAWDLAHAVTMARCVRRALADAKIRVGAFA